MYIPYQNLARATLEALVEDVITREGTYLGDAPELPLDERVLKVIAEIEAGKIKITFDQETESCALELES